MNAKEYANKIWNGYMVIDNDGYALAAAKRWASRIADIPDADINSERAAVRKDAALLILERIERVA